VARDIDGKTIRRAGLHLNGNTLTRGIKKKALCLALFVDA
jgi:hypothetical protein